MRNIVDNFELMELILLVIQSPTCIQLHKHYPALSFLLLSILSTTFSLFKGIYTNIKQL